MSVLQGREKKVFQTLITRIKATAETHQVHRHRRKQGYNRKLDYNCKTGLKQNNCPRNSHGSFSNIPFNLVQ